MRNRVAGFGMALAVACLTGFYAPASGLATDAPFTDAQAAKQLDAVLDPAPGPDGFTDPTADLRDLALALPRLDGQEERQARAVLSRPPDNSASSDPYGGNWPRPAHFEEKTLATTDFVVHWAEYDDCDVEDEGCDEPDLTDVSPANGIPDYVDATAAAVEDSIAVQNDSLGWPDPKGDGNEGEPPASGDSDRFDVYLSDLCDGGDFRPCVFGYASPDGDNSSSCTGAPYKCAAYLVNDNDYAEFGESGGLLGLRVTTAHEYNHVLQFNLDANQDVWMFESTATWSEEQVFPGDDDWVRSYMDAWAQDTTRPLTQSAFKIYGSAVWNHWLENGYGDYGAGVVLDAWELSRLVDPKDDAVASYDQAIKDSGGAGFEQEFTDFTAATAEWNTGLGNLPDHEKDPGGDHLPRVSREGKLRLGERSVKVTLDNTAFRLMKVKTNGADDLKLKVRAQRGVKWGLALVGREGSRFGGSATPIAEYAGKSRREAVVLPDVGDYDRVTAVVTNAGDDKNGKRFKLKVR